MEKRSRYRALSFGNGIRGSIPAIDRRIAARRSRAGIDAGNTICGNPLLNG
jgi:hypothetical protein